MRAPTAVSQFPRAKPVGIVGRITMRCRYTRVAPIHDSLRKVVS